MLLFQSFRSADLPVAIALVAQYGPLISILVVAGIMVTWRDRKNDARLSERIRALEKELNSVALSLRQDGTR